MKRKPGSGAKKRNKDKITAKKVYNTIKNNPLQSEHDLARKFGKFPSFSEV